MTKECKGIISNLNYIAIPLILSSISGIIMGIIDQAFVGRISIYAYAGVGLVTSSINSLVGVLGAMSIAFNILGSQCIGKDNREELNDKFTIYIILSVFIGAVLSILINIFCKTILQTLFGLNGQILKEAINFIRIYSISILLNLIIFIYSTVFKIFRKTENILMVTIIANIINVILDYSLIFGKFGCPKMGSIGAALGTIIALTLNLAIYVFISRDLVKIKFDISNLAIKIKEILNFSISFIGQEFMEDIVFVIGINAIISRMGVLELSTYTLILQIINVVLMPMFGYSMANLSLVSESYAREDMKNSLNISKYSSINLVLLYFIMFFAIFVFKNHIPSIITSDKELIESAKRYIPVGILIQLPNYLMSVYKSSIQAINYQTWALKVTFITNILTLIIILFVGKSLHSVYMFVGLSYVLNYILFYLKYIKEVKV